MASVDWPLLDPEPFGDGIAHGCSGIATSTILGSRTSASVAIDDTPYKGMRMEFCFQSLGGTLVLHTSRLEKCDPCEVRPIQFFPELICTHCQFVLLRLCSTDSNYPTHLFIYSFPCFGKATVHKLVPGLSSSRSLGLLRDKIDCEKYVVANLQRQHRKTGSVEVFFDRWWYSSLSCSFKPREPVVVTLPPGIKMGEWRTDKVVPLWGNLLWIDYRQGILRCSNPLHKDEDAKFDFLYLPDVLYHKVFHPPMLLPRERKRQPETFLSFGSCNGKLMFVKLRICNVNTVEVYIMKWSRQTWQHYQKINLKCTELWDAMRKLDHSPALWLPWDWEVSENHMPCFPVLRPDKYILYLTISRKDHKHAWIIQVDMVSGILVGAADYEGFCNHQKPPYSIHCF